MPNPATNVPKLHRHAVRRGVVDQKYTLRHQPPPLAPTGALREVDSPRKSRCFHRNFSLKTGTLAKILPEFSKKSRLPFQMEFVSHSLCKT
jgi:hypothetical protein